MEDTRQATPEEEEARLVKWWMDKLRRLDTIKWDILIIKHLDSFADGGGGRKEGRIMIGRTDGFGGIKSGDGLEAQK